MTKYAEMVTDPNYIAYHLEKALHLTESGRKGPVWLDIPLDVQSAKIDPNDLIHYALPIDRSLVSEEMIDSVFDKLNLSSGERRLVMFVAVVLILLLRGWCGG